jgi:hypothetical protein
MMTTFIRVSHTTFCGIVHASYVGIVHRVTIQGVVGVRYGFDSHFGQYHLLTLDLDYVWEPAKLHHSSPIFNPSPTSFWSYGPFNCLNLTQLALSTPWHVYFVAVLALLYNTMVEESTSYRPVCESQLQTKLLKVR